ncbi:kinase-like protein [Panus rudis PR-1116 ss-1]|nr:kinase-like protein [Panus rudis PR-1116 ss-1]
MPDSTHSHGPVRLFDHEKFWAEHQPWLAEKGYVLRPRYRPGWTPSWKGEDVFLLDYEDAILPVNGHILDATREADGEAVILKLVHQNVHPLEKEISLFLSREPLVSHPRNHCVPINDVLDVPDMEDSIILVMPVLRPHDDPRMKSVGEALEFFRQIFEGLQFMHQLHIAHRDCTTMNIMMDPKPTFPRGFHPREMQKNSNFQGHAKHYTRTARPTKYYLIDFGLSRKYSPADGPPREPPILGGDRSVPEFQFAPEDPILPVDPFPTDVYYIGNMIREYYMKTKVGLQFMEPLINDMVQTDPSKRPTMDEVVKRFDDIRRRIPWWRLRSRLADKDETGGKHFIRTVHHYYRTTGHILTFRRALPTP